MIASLHPWLGELGIPSKVNIPYAMRGLAD
jgi:hypothetical protein